MLESNLSVDYLKMVARSDEPTSLLHVDSLMALQSLVGKQRVAEHRVKIKIDAL